MTLHRCTDAECPYLGQATNKACGCHQTDEQVLHGALRKLAAEVGALLAFEDGVRAEIGNTNFAVLMLRLEEADAILANARGAA